MIAMTWSCWTIFVTAESAVPGFCESSAVNSWIGWLEIPPAAFTEEDHAEMMLVIVVMLAALEPEHARARADDAGFVGRTGGLVRRRSAAGSAAAGRRAAAAPAYRDTAAEQKAVVPA